MEHIVSACDEIPQFAISYLIIQTWKCVPNYLESFGSLYELSKGKHTALMFMHKIMTNSIGGVTKQQLDLSVER